MEEQEIILEKENRKEQEIILESENISSSGVKDVVVNGKSVVFDDIASIEIPSKTSDLENDSGYLTSIPIEYVTSEKLKNELGYYALSNDIPDKIHEILDETVGDIETLLGGI